MADCTPEPEQLLDARSPSAGFKAPDGGKARRFLINLFRFGIIERLFTSRAYPLVFQAVAGLVFVAIIGYGFFGPPHGGDNFAIMVTWMLWWLILPFTFVLVARIWCGICPLGAVGDAIQKVFPYERREPGSFFRKGGVWIAGLSFLGFAWAGMVWGFDDKPLPTAIILLALLFVVILTSLVYQRRVWCRYLCPLGLMAALYSVVSAIGLRSNRKVCREGCNSTTCYEVRGQVEGCPMFEFPRALDSNRHCILCGKCVKHCPQNSMTLRLHRPFAELWQRWRPTRGESFFIMVLMALVFVEVTRMTTLFPDYMRQALETNLGANYDVIFSVSLLAVIGIATVLYGLSSHLSGLAAGRTSVRYAYVYIPIALAAHLGASIQHLALKGERAAQVAVNQLAGSLTVFDLPAVAKGVFYEVDPPLKAIQLLILALGTAGSLYACWRLAKRANESRALLVALPHLVLIGAFSLSLLFLFLLPMGLLH